MRPTTGNGPEPRSPVRRNGHGPDASLLGHSSGAIYALETARRTPVERLILYEPPLRWAEQGDPNDIVGRVRALTDEAGPEEAAELFFREEGPRVEVAGVLRG